LNGRRDNGFFNGRTGNDKPVGLVSDAIEDCSRRNGIVLDPFLGSGTTVIAAERTGRRARGIELDPVYVDVVAKR